MTNGTPARPDAEDDNVERTTLERLRAEYGQRWRVWRTPRYWLATALVEDVEPTLMEESADALERRMHAPGERVAVPFMREAL